MKEKVTKVVNKAMLPVTSFAMAACLMPMPVFANDINAQAGNLVNNLVGIIAMFGRYIGIALGAWGIIQLALAFKNEDADSKSRALMLIIASIILFNVQTLINMLGMNV